MSALASKRRASLVGHSTRHAVNTLRGPEKRMPQCEVTSALGLPARATWRRLGKFKYAAENSALPTHHFGDEKDHDRSKKASATEQINQRIAGRRKRGSAIMVAMLESPFKNLLGPIEPLPEQTRSNQCTSTGRRSDTLCDAATHAGLRCINRAETHDC